MKTINVNMFKNMLINGANKIASNFAYINELNVFPIPDGDTGTNMKITAQSAANDILNLNAPDLYSLGKTFSRALLMNARGNSGVIFSQIMKGFVSAFKEGQKEISIHDLVECFKKAQEVAYKSVNNPVEGTILTVVRLVAEYLQFNDLSIYESIQDVFQQAVIQAKMALDKTPEMLDELKRVGVVDSGGYGLYMFLIGMFEALEMKDINESINNAKTMAFDDIKQKIKMSFDEHYNEDGFGYCSEIIMKIGARIDPAAKQKKPFNFDEFKAEMEKIGNSLVCVQDEDLVKVHVHTFDPGRFLSYSQQFGEFLKVKFENMTEQYYDRMNKNGVDIISKNKNFSKKKNLEDKQAVVLSCPSSKIKKILANDYDLKNVLNTERNGNPSIQDILMAVQKTKANKVLFITDDTNIVLAANQARDIIREQIDLRVIKGSNIFEALVAALDFNPNISLDSNERNMNNAVKDAVSGMISKSIKDVDYSHISIKKNDYIGIINKKIEVSDSDEFIVLKSMVDSLVKLANDPSILMIYYGDKKDMKYLSELEKYINKKYNLMCEFKDGGQKIYNYLLGIQ